VLAFSILAPLPSFALGRDLTPVRIVTPGYYTQSSLAATTGKGFLLRWSTQTNGYGTTADTAGVPRMPASSMSPSDRRLFPNGDGYLAVSPTGITELDATGAIRRTVAFDQYVSFIDTAAFDGTNFFLLAGDTVNGYTGRLVDRNGHVLVTTKLPIPISGVPDSANDVTASADGGFTAIIGGVGVGVVAVQISAAGQVVSTINVFGAGHSGKYLISATRNADLTLAAWTTYGSAFVHTVGLRGGSVVRDSVLPATTQVSESIALRPSGDGFILLQNAYIFVIPASPQFVLATRLDATGSPREATATLLSGTFAAAAATSQTLVLLAYRDELNASLMEVSLAITDSGIVPSATYDVVATAVQQLAPAVTSDGVDFFGAWLETTSKSMTVMAGRVSRSGLPLDGTGLVVAESPSAPFNAALSNVSVAFGGGVYLVVYAAGPYPAHNVMGRRYTREGTPIDPAPFVITANGSAPSVAFGGDRFLVAWQLTGGLSVAGATVSTDGSMGSLLLLTPAPGQELREESGQVVAPAIGWNGRHFIVAYGMVDPTVGYPFAPRVRVLRASSLGIPIDAHTIEAVSAGSDATIACSDQECLVGSVRAADIVTAVVHDDASLHTDAPKFVANSFRQSLAAVAFDGASYIMSWRTADAFLGVARISRAGDPYAFAASGAVNPNVYIQPASPPALVANSAGDTAIVTSEFNTTWLIERGRFYLASELLMPRRHAAH
jgi:hypothetical protein